MTTFSPLLLALTLALTAPLTRGSVPFGFERSDTSYDWCDCGSGLSSLQVWSGNDGASGSATTVPMNSSVSFNFSAPVSELHWRCDSMSSDQVVSLKEPSSWWSVRLTQDVKSGFFCGRTSGRIKWNSWRSSPAEHESSVPFSSFEDGYACMKIPSLLRTHDGSLLALAEARTPDCGDFSRTDLVFKRSTDGGRSWSSLNLVVRPESGASGLCGHPLVIGNAAPVQVSKTVYLYNQGRILVPHTRNNFEVWVVHSDDDGVTWSSPRRISGVTQTSPNGPDCKRNMSYFGITDATSTAEWVKDLGWSTPGSDPYKRWRQYLYGDWQFIGLGPPGSLELRDSGRILVPGYHSYIRGLSGGGGQGAGVSLPVSQLYNNFALGHAMLSDDGGDTWRLVSPSGFGGGLGEGANEDQFVQLRNGSVLLSSRSLATGSPQQRVQCRSDDGGETFTPTRTVPNLPEPFNGCQGSIVSLNGTLYLSHPNPQKNSGLAPSIVALLGANVNLTGRDHMTVWSSVDDGTSYQVASLVDEGASGYSSLQVDDGGLWILYEQSDPAPVTLSSLSAEALIGGLAVLNPDRFVLRRVLL